MSENVVILMGHLGKDAEFGIGTKTGTPVANMSLATHEWVKGEKQTEWHRIIGFGKAAENMRDMYKKGKEVYVRGRIRTRTYMKDEVQHWITEIIAFKMHLCGPAPKREAGVEPGDYEEMIPDNSAATDAKAPAKLADNDVPFEAESTPPKTKTTKKAEKKTSKKSTPKSKTA